MTTARSGRPSSSAAPSTALSPPPANSASGAGRPARMPGARPSASRTRTPVGRGVLLDPGALPWVGLDRDHAGSEPGALDCYRAGPRAQIPDRPPQPRSEPGQHDRPHLGLRDHRVPVRECLIRQRPARRGTAVPGHPARPRVRSGCGRAGRSRITGRSRINRGRIDGDEHMRIREAAGASGPGSAAGGKFGDALVRTRRAAAPRRRGGPRRAARRLAARRPHRAR